MAKKKNQNPPSPKGYGRAGKNKYKAVIFDLGDVYNQNGFKTALANLVSHHKLPKKYLDCFFEKPFCKKIELGKISEKEYWKEFEKDCGLNDETHKIRKFVFSHFRPKPGMRSLVKKCRTNFKCGLLTNNANCWFDHQNKTEKFNKKFDSIVVSSKVGLRKPDRKIYMLMAKKLKVKPSECVFFDDSINNVIAGKKAGMTAFHFKTVEGCKQDLKKIGIL